MYAKGSKALGLCDRCGFTYKLAELKYEVQDQVRNGLRVCSVCFDPDQPQYRVGEFGEIFQLNDTISFLDLTTYTYNGFESPYSFYPTASAFNLTLNYTPFGNISGTIYQGNLNIGNINGLKFTDITVGSGNQTNYYFWMIRE